MPESNPSLMGNPTATPPTPPAATPPAAPSTDVFASVPKEIRFSKEGVDRLERFKGNANEMAKSYLEMESQFGTRVKLPNEKSTPEEVKQFYSKLGVPEAAEKYEIVRPEPTESGIPYDEELEKVIRQTAFENNIPNNALKALVDTYNKYADNKFPQLLEQQSAMREQQKVDGMKNLSETWKADTEKNIHVARRAVEKYGDDAFKAWIEQSGAGNSPEFVKFCNKVGVSTLDDAFIQGSPPAQNNPNWEPQWPNSPEMYRDDPQGRKYFEAKGHKY